MQSLQNNKVLEFPPDTLQTIRKLYNLDKPGKMDESIDLLVEWLKKQSYFIRKEFPRDYLERIIISSKGSVERSKEKLEKACTMRTLTPEFFEKCNAKLELGDYHKRAYLFCLPKMTEDNYRVAFMKTKPGFKELRTVMSLYRYGVTIFEYLMRHDYSTGFIFIDDQRDVNMLDIVPKINLTDFRNAVTLFVKAYGMRIQAIHIINPSKMVEPFIMIMKQVLSQKLIGRLHLHKSMETVKQAVPEKILPKEFGGCEKTLDEIQNLWLEELSSKDHVDYLKEMRQAGTNESMRPVEKMSPEYESMTGSFKTLCVD